MYENNKFRSYRKDQQGNEYWRCTINGCTARLKTSNGSEVVDLLFPYTNNGAESYHSHLNVEFYVKHPNIYAFVDVLKKIQQTAYVSMNSISQQARQSKYEREKTEFVVSAYYDYRTQLITRKEFLKKVSYRYGPRTEL